MKKNDNKDATKNPSIGLIRLDLYTIIKIQLDMDYKYLYWPLKTKS